MENMYVYKTVSCLKRHLAYDSKGAGYLLNKIRVFNSKTGEVLFSSSRSDIYKGANAKHNFDEKKQIDLGEISRRLKINLTKKGHFVITSGKQDTWDNRTCYDLYLDDAILKGNFGTVVSESALRTSKQDVYYFNIDNQDYHLLSSISTEDKPLDTQKEYQIKKLQFAIDRIKETTTQEELKQALDKYTKNFYIRGDELV